MFLEIDKRRAINLLNFEIKAHTKEWKVIFKSDSSHSNLPITFNFEKRTGNYKIKELFSLKNNSFYFTYSNLSPSLGINITNFPTTIKRFFMFFICRLFVQ